MLRLKLNHVSKRGHRTANVFIPVIGKYHSLHAMSFARRFEKTTSILRRFIHLILMGGSCEPLSDVRRFTLTHRSTMDLARHHTEFEVIFLKRKSINTFPVLNNSVSGYFGWYKMHGSGRLTCRDCMFYWRTCPLGYCNLDCYFSHSLWSEDVPMAFYANGFGTCVA